MTFMRVPPRRSREQHALICHFGRISVSNGFACFIGAVAKKRVLKMLATTPRFRATHCCYFTHAEPEAMATAKFQH
jgi:hypothetical protein